ncbi:hypothetical protein MASR1M59_29610 [Melaminivora sp.]
MLVLPATLTHAQARACAQQLLQAIASGPAGPVRIDAGALLRFDSSALAVLLQCRRAALARASRLQLLNLPPALASLAQLYGVQALLLD